jgi:hypothetical protein
MKYFPVRDSLEPRAIMRKWQYYCGMCFDCITWRSAA